MPTGTVKWFNNAKGYGFILPDTEAVDLFAHYSSIEMDGYKTLKAGQVVSFDIAEGDKGLHATNIRPPDTLPSDTTPKNNTETVASSDTLSQTVMADTDMETYT